ncbi:hypothetical protein, partial [Desulfosporosinus metallidurans]|uniref:hypothetical protein n=1 Tax=Desulfosporosinus metallidurans TaxID=1888891 RepID=UPI000ADC6137
MTPPFVSLAMKEIISFQFSGKEYKGAQGVFIQKCKKERRPVERRSGAWSASGEGGAGAGQIAAGADRADGATPGVAVSGYSSTLPMVVTQQILSH